MVTAQIKSWSEYQPRFYGNFTLTEIILYTILEESVQEPIDDIHFERGADSCTATLENTRERMRQILQVRSTNSGKKGPKRSFSVGDLVLLRRRGLDQVHKCKFEARWQGPYRVAKILNHGHSVILHELSTDLQFGKYHIDHIKLFVPREESNRNKKTIWLWELNRHQQNAAREARGQTEGRVEDDE